MAVLSARADALPTHQRGEMKGGISSARHPAQPRERHRAGSGPCEIVARENARRSAPRGGTMNSSIAPGVIQRDSGRVHERQRSNKSGRSAARCTEDITPSNCRRDEPGSVNELIQRTSSAAVRRNSAKRRLPGRTRPPESHEIERRDACSRAKHRSFRSHSPRAHNP